jgi:hypothetical protein
VEGHADTPSSTSAGGIKAGWAGPGGPARTGDTWGWPGQVLSAVAHQQVPVKSRAEAAERQTREREGLPRPDDCSRQRHRRCSNVSSVARLPRMLVRFQRSSRLGCGAAGAAARYILAASRLTHGSAMPASAAGSKRSRDGAAAFAGGVGGLWSCCTQAARQRAVSMPRERRGCCLPAAHVGEPRAPGALAGSGGRSTTCIVTMTSVPGSPNTCCKPAEDRGHKAR